MRILLLAPHPFFQPRGTPIAERMIVEVLTARGHEIDLLTYPEGEGLDIPNCRIHRLPALPGGRGVRPGFSLKKLAYDAVMLGWCLRAVRRRRFDVVHAVEESVFIALLAKWLFRVPYVYDMDSGLAQQMIDKYRWLRWFRPALEACERLAVRGSLGTLAVCGSLESQARAYDPEGLIARLEDVSLLGAQREGGETIAIHPPEWKGTPLVLYVGNLQPYQGIDLLLAAFERALHEVPEARLVIVGGEAEPIAHYTAAAERRGIGGRVHFAGPRPVAELGASLRQATVLVSPRTLGHNTPMKVYSYLDSGRALLATRLPTHTQLLTDEIACLADPEPEALGGALVRLLQDKLLRERLASKARQLAQREFTPLAFEGKLLRFYEAVAKRIGEDAPDGEIERLETRPQGHR